MTAPGSPPESDNPLRAAALEYAARKVHVVPVMPRERKCLLQGWPELATIDEAQIREWWDQEPNYNVGIRTGVLSDVVALDIDMPGPRHPNVGDGMAALRELEAKYGPIPPTWSGTTGGGGRR